MRWTLVLVLFARLAGAAPLSPGEQASAEMSLTALRADPFAEEPLAALERAFDRGPGRAALTEEFQRRASTDPDPAWHIVLARLALERGRQRDGVRELEKAAESVRSPLAARRLARILDDNNDRPAAIRAYRAGLAGATPAVERDLWLRIGVLSLVEGHAADAAAAFHEAKRISPRDVALRRQIAEAFASRGSYREAIAELHDAEALLGSDAAAKVALLRREAELERRASTRLGAAQVLLRAFHVASQARDAGLEAECAAELLRLYGVRPPHARVPAELMTLVRGDSDDPLSAALVAELLAASGDEPGALAELRRAAHARPNDVWVLRRLCALERGEDRLRDLVILSGLQPNDPALQLDRVGALFDAKRSDQAVAAARAVAASFSENPAVLDELSALLAAQDRPADALPIVQRLLALDHDRPDAVVREGDLLRALHRDADATVSYFKLVEHNPSAVSYRHLIDVLTRRKLTADVKRAYTQALARGDEPLLRRDYARYLAANGAVEEALAEWKKVRTSAKDELLRDYADREIKRLEYQSMLNK